MYGRLNRLLPAAFIAGVVLAAVPPAAFACNGGVSAVNVYKECLSTGGRSESKSKPESKSSSGSKHSTVHTGGGSVSTETKKALAHAGNDKKALKKLIHEGGGVRMLESAESGSTPASQPSAIGSAFDLGSAPTAVLIVLAGAAVLLLGISQARGIRQRRR